MLIDFREKRRKGERERERKREKHRCEKETLISCFLHMPGPGPNPQGRNGFLDHLAYETKLQATEPHWLGPRYCNFNDFFHHLLWKEYCILDLFAINFLNIKKKSLELAFLASAVKCKVSDKCIVLSPKISLLNPCYSHISHH